MAPTNQDGTALYGTRLLQTAQQYGAFFGMWPFFVEKAFAKLFGDFSTIQSGTAEEAP
jgi:hypothetical protein